MSGNLNTRLGFHYNEDNHVILSSRWVAPPKFSQHVILLTTRGFRRVKISAQTDKQFTEENENLFNNE